MSDQDWVECEFEYIRRTDSAMLVHTGQKEIWLPVSVAETDDDPGGMRTSTFQVRRWFVERHGLDEHVS